MVIGNHLRILILINLNPIMTLREIGRRLDLTERCVLRLIGELEEVGYIYREAYGRRNRYYIDKAAVIHSDDNVEIIMADFLAIVRYS